jgi:hypothetical protein
MFTHFQGLRLANPDRFPSDRGDSWPLSARCHRKTSRVINFWHNGTRSLSSLSSRAHGAVLHSGVVGRNRKHRHPAPRRQAAEVVADFVRRAVVARRFHLPHRGRNMTARGHRPGRTGFPEAPSPARAQHSRYRSTVRNMPCAALSGHGPIMAHANQGDALACHVGPLWGSRPLRRTVVAALAGSDNKPPPCGPALAACEQASSGLHSLAAGNPHRQ